MARRSAGVVLIVALVGWTVNWPTFECQGQHSRAAVVVPAGASPAYKPEPSPSRHTCCPQIKSPAKTKLPYSDRSCLVRLYLSADCCSLSHDSREARPPRYLTVSAPEKNLPGSSPTSASLLPVRAQLFAVPSGAPPGLQIPSSTVLRL